VSPPSVNACCLDGQYANALAPWNLGTGLQLKLTSPDITRASIRDTVYRCLSADPCTGGSTHTSSNLIPNLKKYIYNDFNGMSRAAGSWNLGAYEQ